MEQIMEKAAEAFNELSKTNERVTTSNVSAYMKDKYDITLPKNTKLKTIFEKMGYEIHAEEGKPNVVYIVDSKNTNKKINKSKEKEKTLSSKESQGFTIENLSSAIKKLETIIYPENWGKDNQLLREYVKRYLSFIWTKKKDVEFPNLILQDKSNINMFFHTGLYDKSRDSIYGCITKTSLKDVFTITFCSAGDRILQCLTLPKHIAEYDSFQEKIVFNPNLEIRMNSWHLLERAEERIDDEILDFDKLNLRIIKHIFDGELKLLQKHRHLMVNVIPAIYNNEICFFIPLQLTNDGKTNGVLALQREVGSDGIEYNVVRTLLPLGESVYQMARTAQEINIGWLSNFLLDKHKDKKGL
ncbi:DUF3825 domain-containing protein [Campylobacter helveticus]|uniref:DUF3825 domain-containing protein n=1 Tax=Campylobacter helveticus TaxID=28898 RepID=UPI002149A47A|nr:DUF3825 domain-containing protein [Campylobacter helveticus]MCR2061731.1 DUF3825 domain-containing protein [Campylobacter helveticus]